MLRFLLSKHSIPIIVLIFLSSALFMYGLGAASLFETDEYIYTQISKEIIKTGDPITLHFMGKHWFIHPPLYMWLTALSGLLFGFSEAIARIWCAIFGVLGVVVTYLLGKELFSRRVGFLAGIILATTFQYIIQSRIAIFDVPLVTLMLLAIYFFHLARVREEGKYYLLFFASMAFAVLMKGPVGVVLPLLVIILYLVFSGEFRLLLQINWIKGIILFLFIAAPWYIAEWAIHGEEFINTMFGFYTLGRYLTPIETHAGPWYYYFAVIPLGFLPWTAFLPGAVAHLFKDRKERGSLFIILWLVITFVFFSAARTKLPGYIMSLYPFLALGLASFFDGYMSNPRERFNLRWMFISFSLLLLISLLLIILPFTLSSAPIVSGYEKLLTGFLPLVLTVGMGGLIASALYLFMERRIGGPIFILVVSMGILLFFFVHSATPAIEEYKPMKPLSLKAASLIKPGEVVIGYNILYRTGFTFYLGREIKWINNPRTLVKYLRSKKRVYCFIHEEEYENLKGAIRLISYILDKKADVLLISNKE